MARTKASSTRKPVSKKKNNNNKKGLIIAIALVALIAIIGVSYAFFTTSQDGTKTNVIKAGTLTLTLDDASANGILLEKAIPVTDETGLTYTPYEFTVTNSDDSIDAVYDLTLVDTDIDSTLTRMDDTKVKYSLTSVATVDGTAGSEVTVTDLLSNVTDRKIASNVEIKAGDKVEYKLRLWIDSNAGNEVAGQIFSAKINLNGTQLVK